MPSKSRSREEKEKVLKQLLNDRSLLDGEPNIVAPRSKKRTVLESVLGSVRAFDVFDSMQGLHDAQYAIDFAKATWPEIDLSAAENLIEQARGKIQRASEEDWDAVETLSDEGVSLAKQAEDLADKAFKHAAEQKIAADIKGRLNKEPSTKIAQLRAKMLAQPSIHSLVESTKDKKTEVLPDYIPRSTIEALQTTMQAANSDLEAKYARMQKAGLPQGAIEAAMQRDGYIPPQTKQDVEQEVEQILSVEVEPHPIAKIGNGISERRVSFNLDPEVFEPEQSTAPEDAITASRAAYELAELNRKELLENEIARSAAIIETINKEIAEMDVLMQGLQAKIAAAKHNNITVAPVAQAPTEEPINSGAAANAATIKDSPTIAEHFLAMLPPEVAKAMQHEITEDEEQFYTIDDLKAESDLLASLEADVMEVKINAFIEACKNYLLTDGAESNEALARNLKATFDTITLPIAQIINKVYPQEDQVQIRTQQKNRVAAVLIELVNSWFVEHNINAFITSVQIEKAMWLMSIFKSSSILSECYNIEAGGGGYCGDRSILKALRAAYQHQFDDSAEICSKLGYLIKPVDIDYKAGFLNQISVADAEQFRKLYGEYLRANPDLIPDLDAVLNSGSALSAADRIDIITNPNPNNVYWLTDIDLSNIARWLELDINVVQNVILDKNNDRDALFAFHPASGTAPVATINIYNQGFVNRDGLHFKALIAKTTIDQLANSVVVEPNVHEITPQQAETLQTDVVSLAEEIIPAEEQRPTSPPPVRAKPEAPKKPQIIPTTTVPTPRPRIYINPRVSASLNGNVSTAEPSTIEDFEAHLNLLMRQIVTPDHDLTQEQKQTFAQNLLDFETKLNVFTSNKKFERYKSQIILMRSNINGLKILLGVQNSLTENKALTIKKHPPLDRDAIAEIFTEHFTAMLATYRARLEHCYYVLENYALVVDLPIASSRELNTLEDFEILINEYRSECLDPTKNLTEVETQSIVLRLRDFEAKLNAYAISADFEGDERRLQSIYSILEGLKTRLNAEYYTNDQMVLEVAKKISAEDWRRISDTQQELDRVRAELTVLIDRFPRVKVKTGVVDTVASSSVQKVFTMLDTYEKIIDGIHAHGLRSNIASLNVSAKVFDKLSIVSQDLIKQEIKPASDKIKLIRNQIFAEKKNDPLQKQFLDDLQFLCDISFYTMSLLSSRDNNVANTTVEELLFNTVKKFLETFHLNSIDALSPELQGYIRTFDMQSMPKNFMRNNFANTQLLFATLVHSLLDENSTALTETDRHAVSAISAVTSSLVALSLRSPILETDPIVGQQATVNLDYESFSAFVLTEFEVGNNANLFHDYTLFAETEKDENGDTIVNDYGTNNVVLFRGNELDTEDQPVDPKPIATFKPSTTEHSDKYKPLTNCIFTETEEKAGTMGLLRTMLKLAQEKPLDSKKEKYQISFTGINSEQKANDFLLAYQEVIFGGETNQVALAKQIEIVFDENSKALVNAIFTQNSRISDGSEFTAEAAKLISDAGLLRSIREKPQSGRWKFFGSTAKNKRKRNDENSAPNSNGSRAGPSTPRPPS